MKQKIEQQGEYASDGMKIIFGGKVLTDDATVEASDIQEHHKNIVLVAKKLKTVVKKPAPVTETPAPATSSTSAATEPVQTTTTSTPAPTTTTTTTTATPTPTPPATTTTATTTPDTTGMGEQFNILVTQFLEMGFERANIEECLRAAYLNPERAAEYLMTGIPESARRQQQQPATQQSTGAEDVAAMTGGDEDADDMMFGGEGGQLSELIQSMPQFNQLRAAIQQNPHLLTPIMQRLAQSNPELVEIINQNPQEFIRLLNEPIPQQTQQPTAQQQGALGGGGGQRLPPNAIMVSQEERDAIDRLVGMGFERNLVIQAYFACGKDENLTANFLLEDPDLAMLGGGDEQGGDDEEMYGDHQ